MTGVLISLQSEIVKTIWCPAENRTTPNCFLLKGDEACCWTTRLPRFMAPVVRLAGPSHVPLLAKVPMFSSVAVPRQVLIKLSLRYVPMAEQLRRLLWMLLLNNPLTSL